MENIEERLRLAAEQWEIEPNLENLDAFLNLYLQSGQKAWKMEFAWRYKKIVMDWLKELPITLIPTPLEDPNWDIFHPGKYCDILLDELPYLRERRIYLPGPTMDICIRDSGGISVGSTIIKISTNLPSKRYLIEEPRSIYDVPVPIIRNMIQYISTNFQNAGWKPVNTLEALLETHQSKR